jgi:hypothetical protein
MMDPRRPGSDAASYSSASSTGSIWSTTDSLSFVYTDDPDWAWWGYEGVRGAVTRKDDRRDERRLRMAAHFLRGPFAFAGRNKSKKHGGSGSHHRGDSDSRSFSSGSSSSSSSSRRHHGGGGHQFSRGPSSPMMNHPPPPPGVYPGSTHPQHQPRHHPQHFDNFPHGQSMGPPPPPPMAGPPPQAGFEAGFIQIGGGGPPPPHDPVWSHDAQYNGGPEPQVWD